MGTWIRSWQQAALAALCLWLVACGSAMVTPAAIVSTALPLSVTISGAPDVICRAASQLRLLVQASADLASDPAGERALRSYQGQEIRRGTWPVRDGPVLISFSEGQPLSPGQFTVFLSRQETDLAQHTFLIDSQMPNTVDLSLSLTPDGATLTRLPSDLRGFYVGYEFQRGAAWVPRTGRLSGMRRARFSAMRGDEPFLPLVLFDWYTQVVYAGARCRNLRDAAIWRTAWYHEGELVREGQGQWQGAAEGVVWDSLTGVPGNPFLPSGAHTVILAIEDVSMTTAFSAFAYEPANTADGDVITE